MKKFIDLIQHYAQSADLEEVVQIENRLILYIISTVFAFATLFIVVVFKSFDFIPIERRMTILIIYAVSFVVTRLALRYVKSINLQTAIIVITSLSSLLYTYVGLRSYLGVVFFFTYLCYLIIIAFFKSDYDLMTIFIVVFSILLVGHLYEFFYVRGIYTVHAIIPTTAAWLITVAASYIIVSFNRQKIKSMLAKNQSLQANNQALSIQNQEIAELAKRVEISNHQLADTNIQLIKQQDALKASFYTDSLTSLPNRMAIMGMIEDKIATDKSEHPFAVMMIDIDSFKYINDLLGPEMGDEVIQNFSTLIKRCIYPQDFLARVGGDEFLVVFNRDSDNEVVHKKVLAFHEMLKQPLVVKGIKVNLRTSIGISHYPENSQSAAELLRLAEIAMHQVKDNGRNSINYYHAHSQPQFDRRVQIIQSFDDAFARSEFSLVFQPIISLTDQTVSGLEVLLRWRSHKLGDVSPAEFIPVAEGSGMMRKIGEWVIVNSFMAYNELVNVIGRPIDLAINVSSYELESPHYINFVISTLNTYQIAGKHITLEITERTLLNMNDKLLKRCLTLAESGIKLALDDVGSGHFSFDYLLQLPFSTLKIDRLILNRTGSDNSAGKILFHHISQAANELGATVVAEGVESFEQLAYLQGENCHNAQGYYIAKPMPQSILINWLRVHEATSKQ